jgi:hypothetical protein
MTKLKTLAAVAASTLALGGATVATTASAQPWNHDYSNGYRDYHNDYRDNRLTTDYVNRLSWKIDNARSRGVISWRQARDLHMQLREVQPLAWRYERGQARPWEVRRLENVVDRIDSITQGYAYNMRRPYWR